LRITVVPKQLVNINRPNYSDVSRAAGTGLTFGLLAYLVLLAGGCGGGPGTSNNTQPGLAAPPAPSQINSYLGTTGHIWSTKINRTSNQVNGEDTTHYGNQLAGAIVGNFSPLAGYLDITLTTAPAEFTGQTIGFALEMPGQAALVRYGDITYSLIPLAPTNGCTAIGGTVTYNYITVPGVTSPPSWLPDTDSTYGTFQVATDGSNWNFSDITQFTLTGTSPTNPGTGLPAGFCGIGSDGYAVTAASNATNPPVATVTMGFGPTGFFLEDNGSAQGLPAGVVPSNALGAGVGAIGGIQPSSPLNTQSVVGVQYLGFYYEPGIRGQEPPVTQLASFGCAGSNCPTSPSSTAIVGGAFPNTGGTSPVDEPNQPAAQNVVIDLGTQDPNNNGLYPSATVTVSGIKLSAAAAVVTLQNSYAIFLIAVDTVNNVPLAIYLFQR